MAARTSPDTLRSLFSQAMSRMYRDEVRQYGTLLELVADVNAEARRADPALDRRLVENGDTERLTVERHGAIRVGLPRELATLRRLFAVMGMSAVGYYDLSIAGVPVHSTAFRPVEAQALRRNPFRVFTSLLRLELIDDEALRAEAADILSRRAIFTPACLALIDRAERDGGLSEADGQSFVAEALETFRWHEAATVPQATYERLRKAHPLVADVVCFRGPHINHLTPRTLDIDAAQDAMAARGLAAKAVIEGPPRRRVPILLRQTSFKALEEPVAFVGADGAPQPGAHTARFGEIEQRGVALTPEGRALYDRLLGQTRAEGGDYAQALQRNFQAFPDDEDTLRRGGLAYFRPGRTGWTPVTYEDFLPVSAAGIFQSNLGGEGRTDLTENPNQAAFETALGSPVIDPHTLYAREAATPAMAE
jgi:uncharacterized glyoxalase superfamily metalloenzyme YdcJ